MWSVKTALWTVAYKIIAWSNW